MPADPAAESATADDRAEAGVLAPLRHGAFRALAAGRLVDTLGNAIAPVALAFAVLDLTGSLADLGVVVGTRTVASVAFVLFGGALADRLPRRPVLVGSTTLAAASQATVAGLVVSSAALTPLTADRASSSGIVAALAMPAALALLPQTVPPALRQRANSVQRVGANAATILGASAGAGLVVAVGPGGGLALDAATFLVSACCFALVRVPDVRGGAAAESLPRQLRDGWTEFAARSWVWVVVLGFLVINACFGAYTEVLGPFVADRSFGRGAWGLVLAAEAAGLLLGALVSLWVRADRLLLVGCACSAGVALPPLMLALWPAAVPMVATALLAGVGMDVFSVAWETSLQRHIPQARLARVYSYDILGSIVAIPLAQVAAAPVAAALGVRGKLLLATGLVAAAVAAMVGTPAVRGLRQSTGRQST